MSDPIVKGVKRSPSRPISRQNSTSSSAKNRALAGKTARPKPLVKRSASDKAPARKAPKSNTRSGSTAAAKSTSAKSKAAKSKATKAAPARKSPPPKRAAAPSPRRAASKVKAKAPARKPAPPARQQRKPVPVKVTKASPAKSKQLKKAAALPARRPVPPPPPPRKPTQDEAAALRAFERAHKEFARGRFGEARSQFRVLIEKYASVSEVTARARTYLNIAESRLRTESSLPRDADSLYDRGVIELNRGEYVAAQEMFERAIKREPQAAHVHYGLAATRSRLGSVETALESLQRALELQPNLRLRAQHDLDLALLRNDPEFERMVFSPRF
ncbi:MAG TPA: tetratricopeptide repeat protein [Pyrinomonadaceae bacterium]|nr:tetratricopeptide repeat protein [Pyrinomonadaceae bacterium]